MEVVSQNIANANTSRGPDGQPYRRQEVVFESVLSRQMAGASPEANPVEGVKVARIVQDPHPPKLVYDPGNPNADPATGMVAMPDINVHEEMADLIASSRSYEANLAVVKNEKAMALQALSIGKGA